MVKKSFFRRRTSEGIQNLKQMTMDNMRDIPHELLILPKDRAILIDIPNLSTNHEFLWTNQKSEENRKLIKHDQTKLDLPVSAQKTATIDLEEKIQDKIWEAYDEVARHRYPGEFTTITGYKFRNEWGDKILRIVPSLYLTQAAKLTAYIMDLNQNINEITAYDDSRNVIEEGAHIGIKIPSRAKGGRRYDIRFSHVPIEDNDNKYAIIRELKKEPGANTPMNMVSSKIKFERQDSRRGRKKRSDHITFGAHDITGYWMIMKHYYEKGNSVPFEMNPFFLPSPELCAVADKLENNVLVCDKTLENPDYRHLHEAEISMLLNRVVLLNTDPRQWAVRNSEHPKLQDYQWQKIV